MIYFMQYQDEPDGPVKIGFSRDPTQRLADLQIGSYKKLIILGVLPGEGRDERLLHNRFDDDRLDGEWFDLTNDIRALIGQSFHSWVSTPGARGWWATSPSNTQLSPSEINTARTLWSTGFSTSDIARLLSVDECVIYNGRPYIDAAYQAISPNVVSLADARGRNGKVLLSDTNGEVTA